MRTARNGRLPALQGSPVCQKHPDFTLAHVQDIATEDLTQSLKGVDGIIHVASPLVDKGTPEEYISSAMEGTLNVLRQAVAAGVNNVVLTSSWATTLDPNLKQAFQGKTFTSADYGHATKEEILSGKHNPTWVYLASKIIAEEAAWKFASSHPQLNLTTINAPFIYGPFAEGFPTPTAPRNPNDGSLGTNGMIYALLSGVYPPLIPPLFCDVRDVARAHVSAFIRAPSARSGRKRYLVSGGVLTWKDAVSHLASIPSLSKIHPRLPSPSAATPIPGVLSTIDVSEAEEELGMRKSDYIKWEKTVEDTVESLLEAEKVWKLSTSKAAL
ncbi:putative secondary metabolism biosynthetic enzyme [Arthromyces matolae]|nr:putative secondary metabolism biosynthetic enzyme [Arthromyces matolae]